MLRRSGLLCALALVAIAPSLAHAAGELYFDPIYGYQKTSNVLYGTGGTTGGGSMNLLLDVYQPTDIGLGRVQSNRPAVVIQDGGAWTSGDKENGRVVTPAIYLAQRGYTVFIADYRQVGDSPVSGPGPWQSLNISGNGSTMGGIVSIYPSKNVIRAGVEDFATAVSYVRTNAASYGIDSNSIGIIGGSAGGVNAMDLAYNNPPALAQAKAVVAVVATMYGDWDKVQPGAPPLFLWNNALDPVIWYGPDVEPNLHNRLQTTGVYYEQWMEDPDITDHNVHYEQHPLADTNCPWLVDKYGDTSKDALQRMGDFLELKVSNGSVHIPTPSVATVTSIDNQTVWDLDASGNASPIITAANGLLGPVGATHDARGNLYVSDFLQGKVFKVDTTNQVSTFATGPGVLTPAGLNTDASGRVTVDNYLISKIHALNSAGSPTLVGDSSDLLNQPFASAVDPVTGATYVADTGTHQIIKIDAAGNASVFADGSDGLVSPVSVAVDALGDVFIGDALISKIFKFTPGGVASIFADISDGVVTPTGLDFDDNGNLLVANYLANNVLKFTPSGTGSVFANVNRPLGISANHGPLGAPPPGSFASARVPEPSSLALAACGLAALLLMRRRTARR